MGELQDGGRNTRTSDHLVVFRLAEVAGNGHNVQK